MDIMDSSNVLNHKPQSNKLILWLIMGVCILPVLLSTLLWWNGWGPSSKTQGGELIEKPLLVQNCISQNGKKLAAWPETYQHKWLLLWTENSKNSNDSRILLTQQLRLMQGKNRDRVARVYVSEKAYTIPVNGHDKVLTVQGTWCSDMKLTPDSRIPYDQRVYVVDPLGNIMMVLDAKKEPKALHKDITRLLSVSRIG